MIARAFLALVVTAAGVLTCACQGSSATIRKKVSGGAIQATCDEHYNVPQLTVFGANRFVGDRIVLIYGRQTS